MSVETCGYVGFISGSILVEVCVLARTADILHRTVRYLLELSSYAKRSKFIFPSHLPNINLIMDNVHNILRSLP